MKRITAVAAGLLIVEFTVDWLRQPTVRPGPIALQCNSGTSKFRKVMIKPL